MTSTQHELEHNPRISLKAIEYDANAITIWELVAEISAQVPDREWKKLPTDLARKFDDYQKQKYD